MTEDKLGYASLKPEGGIEDDWESRHPEQQIPYADMDEPMKIPDLKPNNSTVSMGNMHWYFNRDKPFTWWQIKLLRFCFGLEVTKNDA